MTEQVRYRIEAGLVSEAESVCERMGISPSAAVSLFFAQMVKAGGLPFRPSEFPVLDEYGVTLAEATLPADVRAKASAALRAVAEGFGNPLAHTGLGIRKLAKRSYEVRVHLQWRIVLLHTEGLLTAYDVMNHDQVRQWLRARK